MKFWQKFLIICFGFCAFLKAQDKPEANDFLLESEVEEISPTEPTKEISVVSASTAYFKIIAEDPKSFGKIKDVLIQAEKIAQEYFDCPSTLSKKINLQIILSQDEGFTEQFYMEPYADGSIYLMLKWDEHLKYDEFCDFIIKAILRKIILERRSYRENSGVPLFLELGLSTLLEQRTTNGFIIDLAREASKLKLLGLKDSLNTEKGVGDPRLNKLSAFWNLLALNKFYNNKNGLKTTCTAFLARADASEIHKHIEKDYSKGNFDKYFRCVVNAEINSRLGGVMTTQDCAEELLRLSFIRKDSENLALGDVDIFKNNQDKEVSKAIELRIIEIKLLLPLINPLYFNTLVSLGEVFEAALKDNESDFYQARQEYIAYFKHAKYMELRAKALLENSIQ